MALQGVASALLEWWQTALDLLLPLPPLCALCGADWFEPPLCSECRRSLCFPPGVHLCPRCRRPLMGGASALCSECAAGDFRLDGVAALGLLDGPLQLAVHKLKFRDRSELARPLGQALAAPVGTLPHPAAVVPVPLHRTRLSERGYNQAALLGAALALSLGVPVRHWLQRPRPTAAQSALGRTARLNNLRGAFAVNAPAGVLQGLHLLLVDDVLTTGATAQAAAEALRAAGASRVSLAVLAVSTTPVIASFG